MYRLIILLWALAAPSMAWAQAAQIQRIEVGEHGIYTADKSNCQRDAQGIERCGRSNVRHAVATSTIPAQLGLEFGLRYRAIGTPAGAQVTLQRAWLLPPPGFRPPAPKPAITRLDREDTFTLGQTVLVTYGFDDAWELVPGPWTLEFWYAGRKVGSYTFTVTKP